MLYHASFCVRHPAETAQLLTEMLGATVIRAPSPPFPPDSWFVLYGDEAGSFIEILPWGTILTPETRFGIGRDERMRPHGGAHVLLGTPRTEDEIRVLSARRGWKVELVDARLFKVLKVWIDDTTLIELLTPAMVAAYTAAFGAMGLASLNGKLRALENPTASDN